MRSGALHSAQMVVLSFQLFEIRYILHSLYEYILLLGVNSSDTHMEYIS